MAVITGYAFVDLMLGLLLLLYFIYWYLTNNDDYWDKRGVTNVRKGFILGTLTGKKSQADSVLELYQKFPGERFVGFYQIKQPFLMVRDIELIHKVLVKDFTHFQDRGFPMLKNDLLSANLFNLTGQVWRALRYKLTPTFTTGKLKGMFDQVLKCGDNMVKRIDDLTEGNRDIESKAVLFEFTADVISSCAFGVQFDPNSQEFNNFTSAVKKIFSPSPSAFLKFFVIFLFPKLAELLSFTTTPKAVGEYFLNLTKATLKYRKDNNIQRNDYLQLLLNLKDQEDSGQVIGLSVSDATEEDAIINQMKYTEDDNQPLSSNFKFFTEETICANSSIFLVAGSETTSSAISFILFELARHPQIQLQLHRELDSVLARHGHLSYQAIKEMTYLDQVIQETQRLYPPLPLLIRQCARTYKVPHSDLVIEKGVVVAIPVIGLHKDPQYYPDPDEFKPDRFADNNFKPNPTYLPFGDGPRICIALRFAVMEIKTSVSRILLQYTVKPSPKTKIPLRFEPRAVVLTAKDGIWLIFEKRKTSAKNQ